MSAPFFGFHPAAWHRAAARRRPAAEADQTQGLRARVSFIRSVKRAGVDETSHRRGQRYATLFHDADAKRLLFATPGRNAATLAT